MSRDAEVFEKLMASDEAKRAYQNDPIFRQVMDAVRSRVAMSADVNDERVARRRKVELIGAE